MHQISLQQLSKYIHKPINKWQNKDICMWLTLNQIDADYDKIKFDQINGNAIKKMKPYDWINIYGVSKFIGRQIAQWLEQQSQEFNQILQANQLANDDQYQENNEQKPQTKEQQNYLSKFSTAEQRQQDNNLKQKQKIVQQIYPQNSLSQKQSILKNNHHQHKLQHKSKSQKYFQINFSQNLNLRKNSDILSHVCIQEEPLQHIDNSIQSANHFDESEDCSNSNSFNTNKVQNIEQQKIQQKKSNNKINETDENKKFQPQSQKQLQQQKQSQNNENLNLKKSVNPNNLNNKKKKKDNKMFYDNKNKLKSKQLLFKDSKVCHFKYFNFPLQPNSNSNSNKISMQKKLYNVQQISSQKNLLSHKPQIFLPTIIQKPKSSVSPTRIQSPHIKFVSSQYIPQPSPPSQNQKSFATFQKKLKLKPSSSDSQITINGNAKIGRFKNNQVVLVDQSVSRSHAQIICQISPTWQIKYFLKDIGSRFGTYIQCKGIQQNIQNKIYLIGDAQIQILSLDINKQINNLNGINKNKFTFDLKVKIYQKIIVLNNRTIVNIGKGVGNHIRIQNNCDNAKIWIQKDKKIYLQGIQGKLYVKLKQQQLYNIQNYVNQNKKVQLVFGWLKSTLQVIQTCIVCGNNRSNCKCNNNQNSNNI